jgi:hypothetical protein
LKKVSACGHDDNKRKSVCDVMMGMGAEMGVLVELTIVRIIAICSGDAWHVPLTNTFSWKYFYLQGLSP